MPGGLSRKLKSAFIVQALLVTFAILAGTLIAGQYAINHLSKRSLNEESARFWQSLEKDPAARPPWSSVLQGYFVPHASRGNGVPGYMRTMRPGLYALHADQRMVLVQDGDAGRLYLTYSQKRLLRYALWLTLAPVLLALLAVFGSTWLTYRIARRVVAPVDWLAREVAEWDPREPDTRMLAPDKLPVDAGQETRQLAGALQRMATRTREFVRRERDFTRDASHELRTPLTVIRVASDLMQGDPELPARMQRSLARIQRSGRDMEAVIDAFLILARESDIEPQRETFDVRDVVYEQVGELRPLLAGKPVEMKVVESGSPRLHASPRVLAVMVGNLLRNACTFTEQGEVEVWIGADRLVIRDTGIGMSEEAVHRAFDPFYRADLENPSGKGMGLSIVRRLGERFDWPVTIDSEPGSGTTATIRFAA